MNKIKGKYMPPNKQTHSIRLTQLVTTFGPGAIYDFPDQSLMTSNIDFWSSNSGCNYDDIFKTVNDERLQDALNAKCFKAINTDTNSKKKEFRVPFIRFPEWYHCPRCNSHKSLKSWKELCYSINPSKWRNQPICINCSTRGYSQVLSPSSILVCCEQGHIDDFPWIEWTHYDSSEGISISCDNPDIKIIHTDNSGLSGLAIKCETCGKINYLTKVFEKDFFKDKKYVKFIDKNKNESQPFSCSGRHPHKETYSKSECTAELRAIQRNALNLYNPVLISSIVIPYDHVKRDLHDRIKSAKYFSVLEDAILNNDDQDWIKILTRKLAEELDEKEYLIKQCVDEILKTKPNSNIYSKDDYRRYEYNIILDNNSLNFDDFKTEKQNAKDYNIPQIEDVVLIKKLKEIVALTGFTRLTQPDNLEFQDTNNTDTSPTNGKIVSLKDFSNECYIANECYGEGIFIKFNEKMLEEWRNIEIVKHKINSLNGRYRNKYKNTHRKITPEFVLLHSIAHMIINELSFSSGYPASALKERIYCDTSSENNDMFGILIYTADSDSEGSLGGLVRQGKSDMLPTIIKNALNRIEWCSSDPICRTSSGQGRDSLNIAACHSCLLLPETSCEERNVLLDRTMIIGDLDDKSFGYFSK